MKNSFVLYTDHFDHITLLDMEQRGELFTNIMLYQRGEKLLEMSPVVTMAFSFIKSQMDKDSEKYEEICKKRSEAGRQGGRPKANGFDEKTKKPNGFSEKQTKAKKADNDNEDDNDIKEKDTNVSKKKSEYTEAFESLWDAYPRRKEKQKAYKAYLARLKEGYSEDELMLAVKRYAEEVRVKGTEDTFVKHAATFFGVNKPFADYLGEYQAPKKSTSKVSKFSNFNERQYSADDYKSLIQM